jgi:hypothetical protein
MTTCSRCGSDRLFQFEGDKTGARLAAILPLVCRSCGLITVGGNVVHFPSEIEDQAKALAARAEEAAIAGGAELKQDLDEGKRVNGFLKKFYEQAFLAGFFRAHAFFRHEAKEGRLRRLRELFRLIKANGVKFPEEDPWYSEFRQLLELGDHDGARPSNEHPPEPPGHPPLS